MNRQSLKLKMMLQDTSSAMVDNILSTYTGNTSTSLDDLHAYPLLKNIFLELNTAISSSAACEHLFSAVGRVFVPSCTKMRDGHFEEQLFCASVWICNTSDSC